MQINRSKTYTDGEQVTVTLSRLNLEPLLASLDSFVAGTPLNRLCENGDLRVVVPQENDEHYERREPGPCFDGII